MRIDVYVNDPSKEEDDAPYLFSMDASHVFAEQEIPFEGRIYKIIKISHFNNDLDVLCNNIGVDPNYKRDGEN